MDISLQKINHAAVLSAGFAAFLLSGVWYSPMVFGPVWTTYRIGGPPEFPEWTMALAPLREIIAAYVLALLITKRSLPSRKNAVTMAWLLWFAFHAVGMAGAILWDHMAWQLGAVHAGDWLMKMTVMALILATWHTRQFPPVGDGT